MRASLFILILIQAILSMISAYLIAQMSFIGRVSIGLFYQKYSILKNMLDTAILLFAAQLLLVVLLFIAKRYFHRYIYFCAVVVVILVTCSSVLETYRHFTTTSYKHMKLLFHSGVYLFWFGGLLSTFWISMSVKNKKRSTTSISTPNQNSLVTLDQTNLDYEKKCNAPSSSNP